jgi:3',5'-cyclic AMP phosphodiesterase CpdA
MSYHRFAREQSQQKRENMLIAHLSDSHLRPRGILYQGLVDSNAMFNAAVRHLNGMFPRPDLVILSGDIVDEGTQAEYAVARDMLAGIVQPLLLIPGNHDNRENFRLCFADHSYLPHSGPLHFVADSHGPVRIIGLDVTIPGAHHGDMDDDAVVWLEDALAREPDRPTIIMMHQPPFESGIPYIDAYLCRRGNRLADIVARFPAIERILCGHIHRFMQLRFGGTCSAQHRARQPPSRFAFGPARRRLLSSSPRHFCCIDGLPIQVL